MNGILRIDAITCIDNKLSVAQPLAFLVFATYHRMIGMLVDFTFVSLTSQARWLNESLRLWAHTGMSK